MCREGLNVCMNYESNLLHNVGVVAEKKSACGGEDSGAKGDDNPFRPNGLRGKK